jgi:DNA polymerase IIIc chi subunit
MLRRNQGSACQQCSACKQAQDIDTAFWQERAHTFIQLFNGANQLQTLGIPLTMRTLNEAAYTMVVRMARTVLTTCVVHKKTVFEE